MAKEFPKRTPKEVQALVRVLGGGRRKLSAAFDPDKRFERPDSAEPVVRAPNEDEGEDQTTVRWGDGTLLGGMLAGEILQETPIEAANKIRIRFAESDEDDPSEWEEQNWMRSQAFFDSWEAIEKLRIARMTGEWYDDPRVEPFVQAAMDRDRQELAADQTKYMEEGLWDFLRGEYAERWKIARNSVIRSAKEWEPRTDFEKGIEDLFGQDIRNAADSDSPVDALLTASAIAEHLILTDETGPGNEPGDNEGDKEGDEDSEGGIGEDDAEGGGEGTGGDSDEGKDDDDGKINPDKLGDKYHPDAKYGTEGGDKPASPSEKTAPPKPLPNKQGMMRRGRQKVVEALGLMSKFGDMERMQGMSVQEFGAEFGHAMKAHAPAKPPIDGKHIQTVLDLPTVPLVLRRDTKLFLEDMQDTSGEVLRRTGIPTAEAWKLNLGQLRVFRQHPKRKGKIVVIIDLSGSMGGWCDHSSHRRSGEAFFAFEIAGAIESQFRNVQVFGFASNSGGTNFVRIPKGQKLACPHEHGSIRQIGSGTPLCAALQFASDELDGMYSGSSSVFITDGDNTGARGFVDNPNGACDGYDHHRRVSEEMHASGMRFLNVITSANGGRHLPQDITVEVLNHGDIPKLAEAFNFLKRRH